MRRRRAALAVLTSSFLCLLATGFAGSAGAGGLTTIVLVVPGESRTASVSMGTPDYDELSRLVGAEKSAPGSTTQPPGVDPSGSAGLSSPTSPTVTLSWLSHDVMVWRLDRVYLNVEGGPWISTQTYTSDASDWSEAPLWRNISANGKELALMLDRLGVGNAEPTPATAPAVAAPPAGSSSAEQATQQTGRRAADSSGPGGWLWGPLGVLLGLLLGVGLTLTAIRWQNAPGPEGGADDRIDTTMDYDEAALVPVPAEESQRPRAETLSSHPAR
ncbi:MAG TPA: hypothetical protein VLL08_19505 [Kineosporiaceae bacterium]|nr:hypothetical protein [Kineosporiaceae bacterium]